MCRAKCSSMVEPHYTMQHIIWFVYTVHQTLPFCCRDAWVWLAKLQWNVSNTDALKTTILVLSSEVSLFQGEINLCWDSLKFADQPSVLISSVSFKRGSTVCLLKLRRPQHLQESSNISCLAIKTGQCQVPPHETTCLPAQ